MQVGALLYHFIALYTSCIYCCIDVGHSNGSHAGPDLLSGGGGGYSCMLLCLVYPTPNCANAGSDLQLVLVVFLLPSNDANT